MKRLLLCVLCLGLAVTARAAKPEDRFLDAYFLIQDGDAAVQKSDWPAAQSKFRDALELLRDLRRTAPTWNPHIIDFRIGYCNGQLDKLRDKLPATPAPTTPAAADVTEPTPGPTATTPAPTTPTTPTEPTAPAEPSTATAEAAEKRIGELTAELNQAREQVQGLQTSRDELQKQLQAALQQVTPAETNTRVEALLEENRKLSGQLAATQQRLEDLSAQADELRAAREKIRSLETSRDELTAKLEAAEARTAQAGSATDARLAELLKRNQELTAELAAAQGQVAALQQSAPAATAAQAAELVRLRQELSEAIARTERSQEELATTRKTLEDVRQELASARTENAELRQSYGNLESKLKEAENKISALELAGSKDEQIIVYLRKENALLKEIADHREGQVTKAPPGTPTRRRGFLWWGRDEPVPPPAEPPAPVVKESASEKLVAEIAATSPPKAATAPAREEVPAVFAPPSADTQALLNEAKAAVAVKDYPAAIAKYRAVLEIDSNNLLALSNLGVLYYQQNNLDEAEPPLRHAVAIAPNDSESRALLGIVCFRKGKIEEAFGELTRAIAINPRHAQAHNYLGITLSEKGWSAAAEQEIRKAIELDPQYADAHFNLAVLYAGLRTPRYELAQYHYQKALDLGAQADPALEAMLKKGETAGPK